MTADVNAILLAAGRGRRIGMPKALLPVEGKTLLERMVGFLQPFAFHRIIAVINGEVMDRLRAEGTKPLPAGVTFVVNRDLDKGQLHSTLLALDEMEGEERNVLLHPVDHPSLRPETIGRILDRAAVDRIIIPTFEGKRGHPPLFGVDTIPCLRRAPLEAGARWVYSAHPDLVVEVETGDRGVLLNVNTREEWLEAENSGRFLPPDG